MGIAALNHPTGLRGAADRRAGETRGVLGRLAVVGVLGVRFGVALVDAVEPVGWVEERSDDTHRGGPDGYRFAQPILRGCGARRFQSSREACVGISPSSLSSARRYWL